VAVDTGRLRQILELEFKKGYNDTAVIGGLDRFLQRWSNNVKKSLNDPAPLKILSQICTPPGYAALDKVQRKAWAEKTQKLLKTFANPSAPKHPPVIGTDAVSPDQKVVSAGGPTQSRIDRTGYSGPNARTPSITACPRQTAQPQSLEASVTLVKGIRDELSRRFAKLGVKTVRDLLYFFPHRHIDYSQRAYINNLMIGQENTIIANVWEAREVHLGIRRSTEATVGDETGNIRIVWFNQPYLAKSLKTGARIVVSGRVSVFGGMPVFESPEWEPYEDKDLVHTGRLIPVYPLTQGLSQRQVRRIIKPAIEQWAWQLAEFLPPELHRRLNLLELPEAIRQAHYPDNETSKASARRRLAFDELFILQLGVLSKKRYWQESQPGSPIRIDQVILGRFLDSLPYRLTGGQTRALQDILDDLQRPVPMSRLLQGEVGSGKTVVATAALILEVQEGYQGALMAPTEILAEQHFNTMRRVLGQVAQEEGEGNILRFSGFLPKPVTIALLVGDFSHIKKHKIQTRIESGEIDIAIGTHALIQKDVQYRNLGLVVVDEQHRFGVAQRSALRQKGKNPHVLVMTATPIPRTLALTLYGDLDLSVIDELPPGRQIVKTRWLKPEQRESAYNFIRRQVKDGRQAFIICPLVEESEAIQARAAVAEYAQLSGEVFPDLRLGLLHGRLSVADKDAVMQKFNAGELDILVSTPVVEVGIDVPNATVMLIESADRFGLSQLHQFRGRVGRGQEQSYCMLLAENPSDISRERLDLIEKVHNGFLLAEEDLKLRGPGEFFGTRQSGLPDLKMARLSDTALLELARREAQQLFKIDPDLHRPENHLLAGELVKVWQLTSSAEAS
jgi:ATP-dependent DNA helicase RecG